MTKKSKGVRQRTRRKMSQPAGYRPPITKFLKTFEIGQNVVLVPEPSSHKGVPYKRFKGKFGKIVEKRGKSYVIELRDGRMLKKVISRPEHLKRI
jgi:large subunit ribosomal protein L21e